jgi:hypothetical protein
MAGAAKNGAMDLIGAQFLWRKRNGHKLARHDGRIGDAQIA